MSASGATAYAWTAADELLSIDPPGASNTVSLTKDALGRHRVRQVNGSTVDTYGYLGESDLVVRLARSSNRARLRKYRAWGSGPLLDYAVP